MKWYKLILLSSIILILGYILGMFFPWLGPCSVDNAPITKGDYYGIIINILYTIVTFLAVVVALWKESILRFFKHPQCTIELLEGGLIENIDLEQQTPQADSYECILKIENKGNSVALGCEICISEILYAKKSSIEKKPIRNLYGDKKLLGELPLDIPPRISKEINLFKIASPTNFGTPDTNEPSNLKIDFNGIQEIPSNRSQNGFWEIRYYMNYKNGESLRFSLNIEWDGSWKNRKSEMKDVLKTKIITL